MKQNFVHGYVQLPTQDVLSSIIAFLSKSNIVIFLKINNLCPSFFFFPFRLIEMLVHIIGISLGSNDHFPFLFFELTVEFVRNLLTVVERHLGLQSIAIGIECAHFYL